MNAFDKYLNETMNILNERSINKIQAEFTEVVNKMSAMAKEYAAAEGDEKANILAELKGLTSKKNDLVKELDNAVAGKDKDVQLAIKESEVTEGRVTLKRRYTENHPAVTVGKNAKIRNKVLEAIKDGKITQEEFDKIVSEISNNSKRWTKNNAQYFTISEEGVSLSKFGQKILKSITVNEGTNENTNEGLNYKKLAKQFVNDEWLDEDDDIKDADEYFDDKLNAFNKEELGNSEEFDNNKTSMSIEVKKLLKGRLKQIFEATTKNPEIWVPGGFDKELSKIPNSKIDMEVVSKLARKYEVDLDDAIKYVEFGWAIDLNENNNTNMTTKFIYESFSEFVNSLNEATITLDATDPKDKDLLKLLKKHKVSMKNLGEGPNGFDEVELSGDRKNLIAVISDSDYGWDDPDLEEYIEESNGTHSITVRSLNEAFASTKLASILTGANKMDKDLPKAFYQMAKIALDKIQDVDIIEMDPATAKKEKRANAIYMYFTTNAKENPYAGKSAWREEKEIPANTLLAITNGQNEWMATEWQKTYSRDKKSSRTLKTTKRDDSAGFAKSGASSQYGSGISSMKQVTELADRAYCLDLTILKARYSTEAQRAERVAARKGATAFMDDKDFKATNKARYNEILSTKAAAMPMDSVVLGAIDTLSEQIKDAIAKGEKGQYGDILIGKDQRGKEVKLNDASNLMRNILDEYSRYCGSVSRNEEEKAAGYTGNFHEGAMKQYAKNITDYVKKIETKSYGW